MSIILEQRLKKNVPITLGGNLSEEFPRDKPLSKFSIRHNSGTLNGTTPTLSANAIFKRITLEVNGSVFIDYRGEYIADVGSIETLLGRALASYKMQYYGGLRAERVDILLKDAIPSGSTKRLLVEIAENATDISSAADSTTYTGATMDFYYEVSDPIEGQWVYEKTKSFNEVIGAQTSGQIFLPSVGGNDYLTHICLAFDESNVLTNTNAPELEIRIGNTIYFEGKWADLQQRASNKSLYAMPTGIVILEVPPLQFGSSDCEIKYSMASTPTACKLHGLMIVEGAM